MTCPSDLSRSRAQVIAVELASGALLWVEDSSSGLTTAGLLNQIVHPATFDEYTAVHTSSDDEAESSGWAIISLQEKIAVKQGRRVGAPLWAPQRPPYPLCPRCYR